MYKVDTSMASAAMPSNDNKEIATSTMVMPRSFFRCAVFTRVTKPSFNSDSA